MKEEEELKNKIRDILNSDLKTRDDVEMLVDLFEQEYQSRVNAISDDEIEKEAMNLFPIRECYYGDKKTPTDDNYIDRKNCIKWQKHFKNKLLKQ